MNKEFRIYGDNIIECERMLQLLLNGLIVKSISYSFSSVACLKANINCSFNDNDYNLAFELLPGFNKNTSDRWDRNIFEIPKNNGSFLDETPDVVISENIKGFEKIHIAIEFCSALQAGNQAWQRSGRAYSIARAKIPYLYIIEFVKYELDGNRKRKTLRFPNPTIPYSYLTFGDDENELVAQVYFKGEEYQPDFDNKLKDFSDDIFGELDASKYVLSLLLDQNFEEYKNELIRKNYNMVIDLSVNANPNKSFTCKDWEELFNNNEDIIEYAIKKNKFKFKKKIADKSSSINTKKFQRIINKYSVGIGSNDLPFGIIPSNNKKEFFKELSSIYPIDTTKIDYSKNLIVCMIKGFKPRGDDNRPDRGILPFIAMLVGENTEILTFLYGPLIRLYKNKLIEDDLLYLSNHNGLWKSIVSLSNYIIVDSNIVSTNETYSNFIDNNKEKERILENKIGNILMNVNNVPTHLSENDVDSLIHILFKYEFNEVSFEGMCNPPGGDWSGMSLIADYEYRWLSLPRVSNNAKRPDHVIQLFNVIKEPITLVIESKGLYYDLENNIGVELKKYINDLTNYIPSVERIKYTSDWKISKTKANVNLNNMFTAGAFLKSDNIDYKSLFARTKVDLIFELNPIVNESKWEINLIVKDKTIYSIFNELLNKKRSGLLDMTINLVLLPV